MYNYAMIEKSCEKNPGIINGTYFPLTLWEFKKLLMFSIMIQWNLLYMIFHSIRLYACIPDELHVISKQQYCTPTRCAAYTHRVHEKASTEEQASKHISNFVGISPAFFFEHIERLILKYWTIVATPKSRVSYVTLFLPFVDFDFDDIGSII